MGEYTAENDAGIVRCDRPEAHARIAVFSNSSASPLEPGVCEYGQHHGGAQ